MFSIFEYFNRGYIFGVKTDKYKPYINYTWQMLPNAKVKNSGTSGVDLQLYSGNPLDFQGSQYTDINVSFGNVGSISYSGTLPTVSNQVVLGNFAINYLYIGNYLGRFAYGLGSSNWGAHNTGFIPVKNQHYNICLTWNNGVSELFVDGISIYTYNYKGAVSVDGVGLGHLKDTSGFYADCQIDYVVICNSILTPTQITQSSQYPNTFYNVMKNDVNTLFCTDFRGNAGYIADSKSYSVGNDRQVAPNSFNLLSGTGTITSNGIDTFKIILNGDGNNSINNNIIFTSLNNPPLDKELFNIKVTITINSGSFYYRSLRFANSNSTTQNYQTITSTKSIEYIHQGGVNNSINQLMLYFGSQNSCDVDVKVEYVKPLTGLYLITNYSATQRTNFRAVPNGLQDLTRSFDNLGFYTGVTDYLNCNGVGYGDTGWKINSASQIGVPFTLEVVDKISYDIAYEGDGRYNYFGFQNNQFKLFGNACELYINKDFNYRVAVYDGSSIVLYVNGVAGTPAPITSLLTSEDTYKIGLMLARPDRNRINPLRLWIAHQKVLTQAEITYNFNKYQERGLLQ